jgi:hypothetical protein
VNSSGLEVRQNWIQGLVSYHEKVLEAQHAKIRNYFISLILFTDFTDEEIEVNLEHGQLYFRNG